MALNLKHKEIILKKRTSYARVELAKLGYDITYHPDNPDVIFFKYKRKSVRLYPFTGYYFGKNIRPGRGIESLLKQI